MKRKFLARVLAVLVAFSLSTTAFADYVAEVALKDQDRASITDDQRFDDLQVALNYAPDSTVYLLRDNYIVEVTGDTIGIGIIMGQHGQTLDLDNKTLIIEGDGQTVVTGVSANAKSDTTIQNGTILVNAKNTTVVFGIVAEQGEMTLNGVTLESTTGFYAAAGTNNGTLDLIDCTILEGAIIAEEEECITVHSGVYGELGDNVELAEGSKNKAGDYLGEEAVDRIQVIVGKNTAAVAVGEDGTVRTYSDLSKAVEKSNGQPITVLKTDDIANLQVKAGDKLNLVDAEGNSLNGEVNLGDNLELGTDGTVSEKNTGGNEGGDNDGDNNGSDTSDVTPVVTPAVVVGTPVGIAGDTTNAAGTEIADEEVPLAGVMTYGEMIAYLYQQAGSPDGEDAEGEYTKAAAWAYANEIADEEIELDEAVTVVMLRDALAAYAEYAEMEIDVDIEGEDEDVVMTCGEILAEIFEK